MKTSTMAIGSASTLAVGALLLGILPFLTTRTPYCIAKGALGGLGGAGSVCRFVG